VFFLPGACAVTVLSLTDLTDQLIDDLCLAAFVMVQQGESWKQPELT